MRLARDVIDHRLAAIDDAANQPGEEAEPLSPEDAEHLARELWDRLGEPTRDLLRTFAEATDPISLREVAQQLDETYETIKARKFRFGRTEKTIKRDWGVDLFDGTWYGEEGANRYRMA